MEVSKWNFQVIKQQPFFWMGREWSFNCGTRQVRDVSAQSSDPTLVVPRVSFLFMISPISGPSKDWIVGWRKSRRWVPVLYCTVLWLCFLSLGWKGKLALNWSMWRRLEEVCCHGNIRYILSHVSLGCYLISTWQKLHFIINRLFVFRWKKVRWKTHNNS